MQCCIHRYFLQNNLWEKKSFWNILNNQGLSKCYQPWPLAWLLTLSQPWLFQISKKPFPIIAYYYYNELINKANNWLTKGVNQKLIKIIINYLLILRVSKLINCLLCTQVKDVTTNSSQLLLLLSHQVILTSFPNEASITYGKVLRTVLSP